MIKKALQKAEQQQQRQQQQQQQPPPQQQQQQIIADAAGKHHFNYSPKKVKKESTLSNPWKEEYQIYYRQKSKRKWPIFVKN